MGAVAGVEDVEPMGYLFRQSIDNGHRVSRQ